MGSKKGLSRRNLEGGNTPFKFLEYDPVRVRPIQRVPFTGCKFKVEKAHSAA